MWSFKPTLASDHTSTPEKITAINIESEKDRSMHLASLMQVKSQVMNYLNRNCNKNIKMASPSNILWVIDHNLKEVTLKGVNLGNVCLDSVSKEYIDALIQPSTYKLRIE